MVVSFIGLFDYNRRIDTECIRAESAHEETQQHLKESQRHLEVASIVIDRLERLMLNALDGSYSPPDDQLDRTARVLKEQLARVRTTQGFNSKLLGPLIRINELVAGRLRKSGRWNDALTLTTETIGLIPSFTRGTRKMKSTAGGRSALFSVPGSLRRIASDPRQHWSVSSRRPPFSRLARARLSGFNRRRFCPMSIFSLANYCAGGPP